MSTLVPFGPFGHAVNKKFQKFANASGHLFVSSLPGDVLWESYLKSFPEGTNPIYRERTEHDCSCCRHFVRNIGNLVYINDDYTLDTIWNVDEELEYPYNVVAETLHNLLIDHPIKTIFFTAERKYGSEKTYEQTDNGVHTWNHFWTEVPGKYINTSPRTIQGSFEGTAQVFKSALLDFELEAVDQVINLINENLLYRGEEHKQSVVEFRKKFIGLKNHPLDNYVWKNIAEQGVRIKNSVIGTLISDLSQGVEIETAVRSFEQKVAPENYKRPKALITKRMVEEAMKTIKSLDLESALARRHAKLSDVSVNNVLWVDNAVQPKMKDGIEGLLMEEVRKTSTKLDKTKAIEIGIDAFMNDVLPNAKQMSVYMTNDLIPHLMSVTAPVNEDTNRLFKWNNDFSWSYNGNIADSDIKQRVKIAGGNVTNAELRVSLSWFNYDDLDLHISNQRGQEIAFYNRNSFGGVLDVDMNIHPTTREAVENISWVKVPDGVYTIQVHNYTKRESIDVGFVIEIENDGNIVQYSYNNPVMSDKYVTVGSITVKNRVIVDRKMSLPASDVRGKEIWGIKTNEFVPVQTVMFSPNHWDEQAIGNKHWFFILEGCLNDEPTRGMYNEFLNSELEKHRKVFEILGDKMKCEVSDEQLSGVGFSSTLRDRSFMIKVVDNKSNKLYNVTFN